MAHAKTGIPQCRRYLWFSQSQSPAARLRIAPQPQCFGRRSSQNGHSICSKTNPISQRSWAIIRSSSRRAPASTRLSVELDVDTSPIRKASGKIHAANTPSDPYHHLVIWYRDLRRLKYNTQHVYNSNTTMPSAQNLINLKSPVRVVALNASRSQARISAFWTFLPM